MVGPDLAGAAQQGRLVISPVIYAEVACGFDRIEDLEEALPSQYFTREPVPWAFARLAPSARPLIVLDPGALQSKPQ